MYEKNGNLLVLTWCYSGLFSTKLPFIKLFFAPNSRQNYQLTPAGAGRCIIEKRKQNSVSVSQLINLTGKCWVYLSEGFKLQRSEVWIVLRKPFHTMGSNQRKSTRDKTVVVLSGEGFSNCSGMRKHYTKALVGTCDKNTLVTFGQKTNKKLPLTST